MIRYLAITVFLIVGCATTKQTQIGGCSHSHELPPLKLDREQKTLLASFSSQPLTALDYYMLLPTQYFSILPADPQRRVSYIDLKTMTRDYISARHWFECDGGGFEITIRVFHRLGGDLIALNSSQDSAVYLFQRDENLAGLNSVALRKPTFWEYTTTWKKIDDKILPSISLENILSQYKNKYKADQVYPDQPKFIDLDYRLLPEGTTIPVIGRENFMDSAPTWAEYSLAGTHFKMK